MWRSLFLILILFSSIAFAQTQEPPKAVKVEEIEVFEIENLTEEDLLGCVDILT